MNKPWAVELLCHYEEHTSDIEDNQILGWTLHKIARSGMCSERVLPTVRCAFRTLQGLSTLKPFQPEICIKRLYNRLNIDYQPIHALCRFFLENSGPTHKTGDRTFIPFVVNMARLFELFVAEWLKMHLPGIYKIKCQEHISFDSAFSFDIDLVIYDTETGDPVCVIDTKYKDPETIATNDIAQVVAYAETKNCRNAILIYPEKVLKPIDTFIGRNRVRTLWFEIDKDISESGENLLRMLLQ